MSARDCLVDDVAAALLDFGEDVVFRAQGKAPRSIQGLPTAGDAGDWKVWTFLNSGTLGINGAALDADRDKLELPLRPGDDPSMRDIVRIVHMNRGRVVVEIR